MAAEGSQHSMGIVAESTYGTTPSSPTFDTLRHTGTTMAITKDGFQSQELRDDRQIVDFRHGVRQITNDISFELSYGGVFDTILEAVLGGTWAEAGVSGTNEDTLTAGQTRRSFSIERKFDSAASGGGDLYQLFTGVEFNSLSLTVQPNGIVTGTFGIFGQDMATGTSSAGSYNSATTATPFDAFSGSISEDSSTISVVTEITLNIDNGMQSRYVIGSDKTLQASIGRSNVTGQATLFFESNTYLDKFINETESSLEFSLSDGSDSYTFTLPRIKYSGGTTDISEGDEGPVSLVLPFQALYSSGDGYNIQITR